MRLPKAIAQYVKGQNARDVTATLACFSKDAFVHDEGQDYRGAAPTVRLRYASDAVTVLEGSLALEGSVYRAGGPRKF